MLRMEGMWEVETVNAPGLGYQVMFDSHKFPPPKKNLLVESGLMGHTKNVLSLMFALYPLLSEEFSLNKQA